MTPQSSDAKDRILSAAITLFSRRGFAAVGVREIAAEADVNIAMISYYFNGKVGILKAIMEQFFDMYCEVLKHVDNMELSVEERFRLIVRGIVYFVRDNRELAMVAFNELPLEIPEITDLKAQRITSLWKRLSSMIEGFDLDPANVFQLAAIGPGLIGTIFNLFRIQPVFTRVFPVTIDDDFYARLADSIAELYLGGLRGLGQSKSAGE